MDPHIYPDPQTSPMNLGAGATGAPLAIEQLTSPGVGGGDQFMFIRVAMSDPAGVALVIPQTPDVTFQIDGAAANPPLTGFTAAQMSGLTYVADAKIETDLIQNFPNVYLITIDFVPFGFVPHNWTITIKNKDAAARDFTWVVSATLPPTIQPWIDVEPTLSWDVMINRVNSEGVQVKNKGTGPLTVSSLSPALPAALVATLPATVNPGLKQTLTVQFTAPATPPAPDGTTNAVAVLQTTPADGTAGTTVGHNKQLTLSARTQALELVMLLDDSGSMTWDPKGANLALGAKDPKSRWGELLNALNNQFLILLGHFGQKAGQMSIARFPTSTATFDVLNPPVNIDDGNIAAAITKVANTDPLFAGTPMGDGLFRVMNGSLATEYFGKDALSINANRRWLLLMTDGAENSDANHDSKEYIHTEFGGTAAGLTDLAAQKIALFAIGYGVKGFSDVQPAVLQNLADSSYNKGGIRRPDDDGVTATQVASAFRDAIKLGITPGSSPSDPPAVFTAGQVEARHPVLITQHDHKAAFVLSWNTPDAKRMRLELVTPSCEVITPENAGQGAFKDVVFHGGNRSQLYLVGPDFLKNAGDPNRTRYGTWTLRVLSPELTGVFELAVVGGQGFGNENYDYDVILDSDLKMDLRLDRSAYYAGDSIGVSARLTAAGRPIEGATVFVSTTAPQQSEANWLASLTVPADALKQAAAQVKGDSTAILIKVVGANLAGMSFPGGTSKANTAMTDPGGIGTYKASVTNTATPELYTFYVTAIGVTDDGVSFRREGKIATNVLVRPDPAFTRLDVQFGDKGTARVVVVPRDRFGNVLLVDPATFPGLGLTVKAGNFTGPLTNNLDGTYSQELQFDPGAVPLIGITFNGQTIQQQTLPPVGNLIWVNKVLKFVLGAEAAKNANQHTNPDAALGDFQTKPKGTFVSFGAYGSLAVGIEGQIIHAQGDDDVTVFVQPDDDPRPYLVEALPEDSDGDDAKDDKWVALGTSPGTTSSFGLRNGKLRAARAIRITDKSGRTRDGGFKPLSTPGVSVRAVGVKSPSSGSGETDTDVCIRLRVLNPQRQPLGGTVDIEFQPQDAGRITKVSAVDASKDIDVKGLQRFPQVHVYGVTVTPTDVFAPTSEFLTIPASGFNTVEFIVDKSKPSKR